MAELVREYVDAYATAYRWLVEQLDGQWEAALAATCCPFSRYWRELRAAVDATIERTAS